RPPRKGVGPGVELRRVIGRNILLSVLRYLSADFFKGSVGETKERGLKCLGKNRRAGELVDLLLFDSVRRDGDDFTAADENGSGHLSHHRFEERDGTPV